MHARAQSQVQQIKWWTYDDVCDAMADPALHAPLLQRQSEILGCLGIGSIQSHSSLASLPFPLCPAVACDIINGGTRPAQEKLPSVPFVQAAAAPCSARPVAEGDDDDEGCEFSICLILKLAMSFFFVYSAMNALSGYVTSVLPDVLGDLSLFVLQATLGVSALAAPTIVAMVGELRGMMIGGMAHVLYFTALTQPTLRWLVLAASAICGFGSSITWVAHGSFLTRCSHPKKRGLYAGVFWGIFHLSGIAGNLSSFLLFERLSHAAMFSVGAVSAAFGVILLLFIHDPSPRPAGSVLKSTAQGNQACQRFNAGSLAVLLLLAPMIFYAGSNSAFRTAEFTKLLPTHAIGAVLVCTGVGQVIGSFFLSWLSDLLRHSTPTFLIGVLCAALGILVCPTLHTDPSSSSSPLHLQPHDPNAWPLIFNVPSLAFLGGLSFGIADGVMTSHMFAMFGRAFQGHGPFVWAIFSLVGNAGAVATYSMGILFPMQPSHDPISTQLLAQAILITSAAPLYVMVDAFSLHRLPLSRARREAACTTAAMP